MNEFEATFAEEVPLEVRLEANPLPPLPSTEVDSR